MSNGLTLCPECEGTGTDPERELVFTGSDLDEWYGDDMGEREQFISDYLRGGYSHPCQTCHGKRVVREADLEDIEARLADKWEMIHEQRMGY